MEFRILGPLEVLDEGRTVALGGSKPRALLALLLLHRGETLGTERLIDGLWGERPPATAAKSLRVHVSRLRRALAGGRGGRPEDLLVTRGHGYQLVLDPERLDAHRFERLLAEGRGELAAKRPQHAAAALEAGLSLWRGRPLDDLAYEPFAQSEIARLEEVRLAATEELVEARLALGRHAEVVAQLEALIADHPYRERLRAQLMLALYRCDRQAEALQAYQDARRTLVEQLGIEPGERLRGLEQAILAQDTTLAAPALGTVELPPELDTATPLAGREAELDWLREQWRRAHAGAGTLVLVAGARGMGKTRLSAELAAEVLRDRGRVLYASGARPAEAARGMLGDAREAGRPTLVVLDDVDLAGRELLTAVSELVDGLSALPVLVLATAERPALAPTLGADATLALAPLDVDAVRLVAQLYAGARNDVEIPVERLAAASGGVPRRVHRAAGEWARGEAAHRPPPPPAPPTATIGRETDLATLARILGESRLVTLTGPPGVGKTRLAVETARARAGRLPGGVRVAWLAPVADAADVAAALAAAVEAVPRPGERPLDALVRRLGGPATLLVVDNFEHVVSAAGLLSELLAGCHQLRILATSREPLRLRGERCVPVTPLDVADGITLFVVRARDRRPDFRVTDDNTAAVEELCRRLDGLPLALELAAGRIGLLEPEQLVARLRDALPVLEGGPRDAPARQRTVRATLEWSVALLDEHERRAFLALAAFTGGAEVDAAERVTEAPLGVLDALVAKSLVRLRDGRLALLEVVRQFAAAGLGESAQRDAVLERHAEWCLELAERLGPEVRVKGEGPALRRLQTEFGNLRTALAWLLDRGDGERSLRLATALGPYWGTRDHDREGLRALDAALEAAGAASDRLRARAHLARWELTWSHRDARRDDAGEALALARAGDDLEAQCMALEALARDAAWAMDFGHAREFAREARALAEELGDPYHVAMAVSRQAYVAQRLPEALAFATEATALLRRCGSVHEIAQMLIGVVMVAFDDEDYEAAEELAAEGVRAAGESGNPHLLSIALGNAGLSALFLDRIDVAQRRYRDQLAICRRERFEDEWAAEPVLGLASVVAHAGEWQRAAVLVGASEEPFRRRLTTADEPVIDRWFARFFGPARAALGAAAWAAAEAEGRALPRETAFDLALADEDGVPAAAGTVRGGG